MTEKDAGRTDVSDREIVIERVFDAPRQLVFEAWTDPGNQTLDRLGKYLSQL